MKLILAVVLVLAIYYKHANASTDLRQNATDVERPMKTVWVKESLLGWFKFTFFDEFFIKLLFKVY
jgi:uncharacterized membrane protein YozB (DUF420 family)